MATAARALRTDDHDFDDDLWVLREQPAPSHDASKSRANGNWLVIGYGAFLATLIPLFLWAGRGEWFAFDDWDYLVNRKAGSLDDLLRPHSGQWEAIPVLVYRGLWSIFGLRYWPYQLVSIVLSLAGALLLLIVMLRARTRPWIAMTIATLLVLFGDAQPNVALRVTSITFVGFAVPLGLLHLLLADHDGPLDRRDWIGLGFGLVGLLCSSVAIAMVFVVGVAMLVKRGWRVAIFHVLPPAVAFAAWFGLVGRNTVDAGESARLRPLPQALHFASVLVTGTFEALTRANGIGAVLVVAFVIGLVVLLRHAGSERRKEAIVPCAMLGGALFLAVETGLGRADFLELGADHVRQGHYMYVVACLSLPAFAWLAEQLARRWRLFAPALAALLVVAVAANTHALVTGARASAPERARFRDTILAIPSLALAGKVPPTVKPFSGTATPISVGWLVESGREGRIPRPHDVTPATRAAAELRISLVVGPSRTTPCHAFEGDETRHLGTRGALRFRGGGIWAVQVAGGKPIAAVFFRAFDLPYEWQLNNVGHPVTLRFHPPQSKFPAPMLCD